MNKTKGWKPLPLSLKILFVILTLWVIGSIFAIPMRAESGLPFFGLYFYGITAIIVLTLLDIVAPIIFLVGAWKRKHWAPKVAFTYMGIFVANSFVAFFTVREELGALPIIMPALFTIVFMIIVHKNKNYFT